ncbi:MAG: NAD-dependent epimerase/dehydratase family protein, partial [Candidatus Cybelea sp.]
MASGDRVFLTGATGFVGSHVLRELIAAGYRVRALRRTAVPAQDDTAAVDWIAGDLRDVGGFARALRGCRYLIHCGALYSFAPRDRAEMKAINVDATTSLMLAGHLAGLDRAILTSSSATEGHAQSGYHLSKVEQERAAFASRLPVVALLPTAPVGP